MNEESLVFLRSGFFPSLGVFGCCCSVGCTGLEIQHCEEGLLPVFHLWFLCFRLEEVVTLALDLLTQSPVISVVVSLSILPEVP